MAPPRKHPSLFDHLLALSVESKRRFFEGTPCWEFTGYKHAKGYGVIAMRVPGKKNAQGVRVHRLMAEIVVGRKLDPDTETIEHACGTTWCINYMHLRLASRADNTADMRIRRIEGEKSSRRKQFEPLVDEGRYIVDRFVRSLPILREQRQTTEAPF